jgi:hypothetical protein
MSRFVRHQDASIRIGSDDSGGTAFDQNFKLFFCLSAGIPLPLDFVKMLDDYLAVAVYFVNEQSYAEEGREIEYVAGHPYSEAPDKLIEVLCNDCAKHSDASDLPRTQDPAHHEHGQQIKEAERQIVGKTPIDERDGRDQETGPKQNGSLAASK